MRLTYEDDVGFRERMVPVKTALIVLVAALCWLISIGEVVYDGFSIEVVLWAGLAIFTTFLTVRRIGTVRAWRSSRQNSVD
jgi:hypothetical protein